MKVLFVCTANKDRSKTAELHFSSMYANINFKSAGISAIHTKAANSTFISQELVSWADLIICMESEHSSFINEFFIDIPTLTVIDLQDNYMYNSPELIKKLETSVLPILQSKILSK